VGALVRVDADHDHRDPPNIKEMGRTAVGTPDSRCRAAALFRATPQWNTGGPASRNRKPDPRAGRQFVSNDRQRSTDATSTPAAPHRLNQADLGGIASPCRHVGDPAVRGPVLALLATCRGSRRLLAAVASWAVAGAASEGVRGEPAGSEGPCGDEHVRYLADC
jgi:hypothetical protein